MAQQTFAVTGEQAGQRLDVTVAAFIGVARNQARNWIDGERVQVNGIPAKASLLLAEGDAITVDAPELRAPTHNAPELTVLYEDDDMFIVDKPAGLIVHDTEAGTDAPTVAAWAATRVQDNDVERPGIVHRLDRDTSGLLVLAKTPQAKEALQKLWHDREVHKTYQALVSGAMDDAEATINLPIARNRNMPTKRSVVSGGRPSITHYKTVGVYPGATLLEVDLETGRTHQIRVHLSHLGHPVVGDDLYGGRPSKTSTLPRLGRQFLHANRIQFIGPSGQKIDVVSPLPADLQVYLDELTPKAV